MILFKKLANYLEYKIRPVKPVIFFVDICGAIVVKGDDKHE
jgi:hypothetical protein